MNKRSFLRSLAGAVMAVAMAKSLGATEPETPTLEDYKVTIYGLDLGFDPDSVGEWTYYPDFSTYTYTAVWRP